MAERGKEKRGLGRGLSALMADIDPGVVASTKPSSTGSSEQRIPIERIQPNPNQPRTDFQKEDLDELANSIKERGVIQPLIVRPHPDRASDYEIVAGERRWRAAQLAQVHELPVIVRQMDDTEMLEIAIIENVQRADLNPVEEALGYRQLQDNFGHTQEQLSKALGKSRPHIANLLRLLNLPEAVLQMLRDGKLSSGHARALITSEDSEAIAKDVIKRGLSVRETEKLVKQPKKGKKPESEAVPSKDADTLALEGDLSASIGMKVSIDHDSDRESGKITIKYKDFSELDEICRRLAGVT